MMKKQWTNPFTQKVHSVDAELEDSLLQALNMFKNLQMDSVCFGHEDGSEFCRKAFPYLLFTVHVRTAEGQIDVQSAATVISLRFKDFATAHFQTTPEAVLRSEGPPARQDPLREQTRSWFTKALEILGLVDSELTALRCRTSD